MPLNYLESALIKRLKLSHPFLFAGLMMAVAIIFGFLTLIFIYVSNQAKNEVEHIRQDYQNVAKRRDAKVDEVVRHQKEQGGQLKDLQHKVDSLPAVTADKTADKVKQVVEDAPK